MHYLFTLWFQAFAITISVQGQKFPNSTLFSHLFLKCLFFHSDSLYALDDIPLIQDLKKCSFPSSHTHLPIGPSIRVGRRGTRVETRDMLSRSRRGEAHALIGGELVRSLAIISRLGNRQLQKHRPADERQAQRDGEAHQSQKCGEERRKERKELILHKNKLKKIMVCVKRWNKDDMKKEWRGGLEGKKKQRLRVKIKKAAKPAHFVQRNIPLRHNYKPLLL